MCGGELRGVDCEVGEIVTDSRRQAFGQRVKSSPKR